MKIRDRVAVLALAISSAPVLAQVRSFGEAEGFGAFASGGRGGTIYHVTNLNDSGAGSFRDAVSTAGRVVVFDVGGFTTLTTSVHVASSVTILGQTAPGKGFGVYGREVTCGSNDNIIIRGLRFRPGDNAPDTDNGINLYAASNIIIDHTSVEFAGWNNIDGTTGMNTITVQNSIIADPINQQFGAHTEGDNITWANNLWSSAHNRQPLAKADTVYVNNVVYNYGGGYTAGNSAGVWNHDIVNNYFIQGPAGDGTEFYQVTDQNLYRSGNYVDTNRDSTLNGSNFSNSGTGAWSATTSAMPTLSATAAYAYAMAHAGANPLNRDDLDALVVSQIATLGNGVTGTGAGTAGPDGGMYHHAYNSGLANGGLGTLASVSWAAGTDSDGDGIPNNWETAHGMNTASAADAALLNPVGYMMVEQYASELLDSNTTRTWTAASGSFNTTGNWTGSVLPGPFDVANIRGTGATAGAATLSSGSANVMRLALGGSTAASGEKLSISGSADLNVYDTLTIGELNNASLSLTGGTLSAFNVVLGNRVYSPATTTYSGTLSMSGGTLEIAQLVLGGGTPGNWTTGGSMFWTGGTVRAQSGFFINVPISVSASGGTIDSNNYDGTVAGIISGTGNLTKINAGVMTMVGLHSYTGTTTIAGGTLAVAALANGGVPSNLGASSNGASNLVLDGGTLQANSGSSTDRAMTITANGGGLRASNSAGLTFNGAIGTSGTGARTLTFEQTGGSTTTSTITSAITDTAASALSLNKIGAGRLSLSGTQKTYSGDTTVSAGTLMLFATNVLPYGAGKGDVNMLSGATLDLRNSTNINGLDGAGTVANNSGGSRTLTLGNGDASGAFSGSVNQGTTIVKLGLGTQIFSGSNGYTGATTISAGALQFNTVTSIGGTGASVSIATSAIAAAGYAMDQAFLARVNTSSTGAVALAANSANNLDFSASGANLASVSLGATVNSTYTGVLTPSGTTYRLGGGTAQLTLSNANALTGARNVNCIPGGVIAVSSSNDYSGTTTISGTLAISVLASGGMASGLGNSSNSAANVILDGGTLRFVGSVGVTSDRNFTVTPNGGAIENSGSAGITYAASSPVVFSGAGNRTLTLGGSHYNANGNNTFLTPIADPTSGFTSVTKAGNGRWFFSSISNTYSGDTTVNAGDLYAGASNVLPSGAGKGNLVINGGRFFMFSNSQAINGLSGSGGSVDSSGSKTLTVGNGNASANYFGQIVNSTTLTKVGTGTQTLSGSSTYTSATNVSAGVLRVDGSISGSSNITVSSSATFQAGSTQTVKALTLNSGSTAEIVPGNRSVLTTNAITLAGTARMNLSDGALIVPSTGTLNGSSISVSSLRNALITGRGAAGTGGATWSGAGGIGTSAFTLESANSLGYVWNADPNLLILGGVTVVNGIPLTGTDFAVKFTRAGDANLDGIVDNIDVGIIGLRYLSTLGNQWYQGDFNYDGVVNNDDVAILGLAYNPSATPLSPQYRAPLALESASIVPEPSAMTALALLGLSLRRRRSTPAASVR